MLLFIGEFIAFTSYQLDRYFNVFSFGVLTFAAIQAANFRLSILFMESVFFVKWNVVQKCTQLINVSVTLIVYTIQKKKKQSSFNLHSIWFFVSNKISKIDIHQNFKWKKTRNAIDFWKLTSYSKCSRLICYSFYFDVVLWQINVRSKDIIL